MNEKLLSIAKEAKFDVILKVVYASAKSKKTLNQRTAVEALEKIGGE